MQWTGQSTNYNTSVAGSFNDFGIIRGGTLTAQNESSSISLNFVWITRRPIGVGTGVGGIDGPPLAENYDGLFSQSPATVSWFQFKPVSVSGGGGIISTNVGNPFLNKTLYLGLGAGNNATAPVIGSGIGFQVTSDNPALDNSVFNRVLLSGYQVTSVTDTPLPQNASVPESSPLVGLLMVAAIGFSLIVKGCWSRA